MSTYKPDNAKEALDIFIIEMNFLLKGLDA